MITLNILFSPHFLGSRFPAGAHRADTAPLPVWRQAGRAAVCCGVQKQLLSLRIQEHPQRISVCIHNLCCKTCIHHTGLNIRPCVYKVSTDCFGVHHYCCTSVSITGKQANLRNGSIRKCICKLSQSFLQVFFRCILLL